MLAWKQYRTVPDKKRRLGDPDKNIPNAGDSFRLTTVASCSKRERKKIDEKVHDADTVEHWNQGREENDDRAHAVHEIC